MSLSAATAGPPLVTDAELISASVDEPEVFRELFDRHYVAVRRYAVARVGADAADDIAAETFARAFDGRRRYRRDRVDAAPWLLGIATNVIRRSRRTEQTRLRMLATLPPADAADPLEPRERRPELAEALAQLHRRDRDVLLLYALGELSYAEIAVALDISEGTVRSRLHRARRIVKEALDS